MSDDMKVIYRTDSPAARAHFEAHEKARKAWWRRVKKLEKEVGREAVCLLGWDGGVVAGFEWPYLESAAVGRSLRRPEVAPHMKVTRERSREYLTPRLSTAEGKALKARMDEVGTLPDIRDGLPGGLPGHYGMFGRPGMEWHEGGKALYVLYGSEPMWSNVTPKDGFDFAMWEQVKLSDYYRVVEDEAARGVDGLGEPVKESVPA